MPYLEHLYCDNCGHPFNLDLNYETTLDAYRKDKRPHINLNSATMIWDYMIYSCNKCNKDYRLTFRDVEKRVRKFLGTLGAKYDDYMDELTSYNASEKARKSGSFFKNKDAEIKKKITNRYSVG